MQVWLGTLKGCVGIAPSEKAEVYQALWHRMFSAEGEEEVPLIRIVEAGRLQVRVQWGITKSQCWISAEVHSVLNEEEFSCPCRVQVEEEGVVVFIGLPDWLRKAEGKIELTAVGMR